MHKKHAVLVVLVLLAFVLHGCGTQNNSYTSISDYGCWTDSVASILAESFSQSLPDKQTVCDYGKNHYYRSTQALLGDLNFVIYVVLQFEDKDSYERELSKYTALCQNVGVTANNTLHYVIQGSFEESSEYMDDKIYDGMFYNFEIISANAEEYSICFINAQVWDYFLDQVLTDYLQQIYNSSR